MAAWLTKSVGGGEWGGKRGLVIRGQKRGEGVPETKSVLKRDNFDTECSAREITFTKAAKLARPPAGRNWGAESKF